jgi:ComF family protein
MADSAFALVFPAACPVCAQEVPQAGWVGVCDSCWQQIQPWSGPLCAGCGLPFAAPSVQEGTESLCGICRRGEYEFDFARSYGVYAELLRSAILLLKFQRRERLGLRLGGLLAPLWAAQQEFREAEQSMLVPVPLHRVRQRERGFNQAEILARGLVRGLKAFSRLRPQIDMRLLERVRPTVPQTGLSFRARRENVRGVFKVKSPERVRGRVVVLVDDVMTTGATLSSCASALKNAQARLVLAMTLARATPQFPDAASPEVAGAVDDFA